MIRQFRPEDSHPCRDLIHECIRSDRLLSSDVRDALLGAETAETIRERSTLYYLVVDERDGEITAVGGVDMNEVRLLFVAPAHQGQGIGHALLDHLEDMVPPALFREVFVYAAPASEPFYRRCGYRSRGPHPFEAHSVVIETIFMVKPLDPPL